MERLEQLPAEAFMEAVEARYEHFSMQGSVQAPVEEGALVQLYETFEGDMRNTFQVAASSVVEASVTQTDPSSLDEREILTLLANRLEAQFLGLPDSENAIVAHLLEEGSVDSRQALCSAVGIPQPTVSQATRRAENKRWLSTYRDGTRLRYRLSGYGRLLARARELRLVGVKGRPFSVYADGSRRFPLVCPRRGKHG